MNKRVVVTGMGVVSSAGADIDSFWRHVSLGIPATKTVRRFDASMFRCRHAGEIADFNPRDFISREMIRNLDRVTCFSLAASKLALADACFSVDNTTSATTGIVLGSMYGGWESIAEFHRQMLQYKLKRVNPLLFPNTVPNSPASQVAIEFKLRGLNNSLTTGFASASDAIGWAAQYIRLGRAGRILSGGTEELNPWIMGSFEKLGYLVPSNADGAGAFRPFDKNRNGFLLGEGAGIIFLEELRNAQKRKAKIHAEILGFGSGYNASPDGSGLEAALTNTLDNAAIGPSDVDYINAEGNALSASDALESKALKNVFGKAIHNIPVSSIKPIIGHTVGAAAAFDAIACILAIQNGVIPPTLHYQVKDPACDLDYAPLQDANPRKKNIDIALSLSLSPDGNSSCLIFKKIT